MTYILKINTITYIYNNYLYSYVFCILPFEDIYFSSNFVLAFDSRGYIWLYFAIFCETVILLVGWHTIVVEGIVANLESDTVLYTY